MSKPLRALVWTLCIGLLLAPTCQPAAPSNVLSATLPIGGGKGISQILLR